MAKQDCNPGTGAGAPTEQPAEQPVSRALTAAEVDMLRRLVTKAIGRETQDVARLHPGSLLRQMHCDRADGLRHALYCLDLILEERS